MVCSNKGNAFSKTNVNTLKDAMHMVAPVRRTLVYKQSESFVYFQHKCFYYSHPLW